MTEVNICNSVDPTTKVCNLGEQPCTTTTNLHLGRLLRGAAFALASLLAGAAQAAAPGITGTGTAGPST